MCHISIVSAAAAARQMLHYELPCSPWEVVGANFFITTNYYSKFLIVKKMGSPAVDDLLEITKKKFAEYGLPKKII